MLNSRQQLGRRGEKSVVGFLKKKGYKILATNYRCRLGEIDIIAKDGLELVFIEVKTRTGLGYGSPAGAVDIRKQRQISRAAQTYLAKNNLFDEPARFDVISVLSTKSQLQIEQITNAFDLCD